MLAEVGAVSRFTVFVHAAGTPQTALTFANMNMHVAVNGARVVDPTAGGYAMAMTEIDSVAAQGYYSIVITPQVAGHLSVYVTHPTFSVENDSQDLEVHSISLSDLAIVATQAGANTVTITVNDGALPLADVGVDIFAADDLTPILLGMTTDSSGQVVVALDAATYNTHLSKALVTFTVPEPLVVVGAPLAQTYSGVVATPSAGTATTVVVTGTLLNVDGTAMEDTEVKAQIVSHPTIISAMGVGTPSATTYTNSVGYFELTLLRNATVNLVVPAIGLRQQVVTPNAPTVDFSTLL